MATHFKFHYKNYSQGIIRPVIPIEISYKNKRVIYEVLIDSGADTCFLDVRIGKYLGITIEDGEKSKVVGITGVEEIHFTHTVTLKVGDTEYEAKVGFLDGIFELGYGIVGQIGFFDKFKVSFNNSNKTIFLKKF